MAKRRSAVDSHQSATANRLLSVLSAEDYRRLQPFLEPVPLKLKRILYKPGEIVDYVYFPGGGFVSVVTVLANGGMVEVATIGNEGVVGLSAVAVGYREPTLTMVQMETNVCHRMPVAAFRRELDRHGALQDVVSRFSQALMGVIMQSTACNATAHHRAAVCPLAADGARSRRGRLVSVDAGVPGDDARRRAGRPSPSWPERNNAPASSPTGAG